MSSLSHQSLAGGPGYHSLIHTTEETCSLLSSPLLPLSGPQTPKQHWLAWLVVSVARDASHSEPRPGDRKKKKRRNTDGTLAQSCDRPMVDEADEAPPTCILQPVPSFTDACVMSQCLPTSREIAPGDGHPQCYPRLSIYAQRWSLDLCVGFHAESRRLALGLVCFSISA